MSRVEDLLAAYGEANPLAIAAQWLDEARGVAPEHRAMSLATIDEDGTPSVRMVLLRGLDDRGFTWYTNQDSRKGKALAANPVAAICLFHQPFERQIRAEGRVVMVDAQEADDYFHGRPRGHQFGAWASAQSEPLPDRAELVAREQAAMERFGDGEIDRPPYWGGYRLEPRAIELWQGQENRLHDRIRFERTLEGFSVARLQP
jgi:pyridoxamine 5'-phosphate oxidase